MGAKMSDAESETETCLISNLLPVFPFPDKRSKANKKHKNIEAHIPLRLLRGSIETTVSLH